MSGSLLSFPYSLKILNKCQKEFTESTVLKLLGVNHFLHYQKCKGMLCCHFSCVWLCATLWTVAPPGSSVHGILQARILVWVGMPFSKGSSQPRDRTHISQSPALAGGFFTTSPTWETPKCAYTQLFWVPYSFFVFCWWKRLSRCKQCSTGPGSQPVLVDSPLYNMTVAGQATHQATPVLWQHSGSWLPMSFHSAASECLHPRDLLSAAWVGTWASSGLGSPPAPLLSSVSEPEPWGGRLFLSLSFFGYFLSPRYP